MEILAISILLLVAAALLTAGLYALFGQASTNSGTKRKQQVANGFQVGGGIVLGILLTAAFIGSLQAAFFNKATTHSKPLVFAILILSLLLIALLENRWAKYFAGWVGYGVWNGLLMISSGHLVSDSTIPIARSTALQMTALCFVTALVSVRFTCEYRLSLVDKAALLGWVLTMGVGVQDDRYAVPAMALGCMFVCLAWLYHRFQNRSAGRQRARTRRATTA